MEKVGYGIKKLKALQSSNFLCPFSVAEGTNRNLLVNPSFNQVVTMSARNIYPKHV